MKTLITAAALTLALAVPAFAQDAKPVIPPAATPAQTAPVTPETVAPKAATPAPVAPKAAAPAPAAPKAATAPAPAATKTAAPAAAATKAATPVAAPAATKAAAPAAAAPKTAAPATPAVTKAVAAVKLVNLNTATAAELDALPKIGKARTKAIIAGRPYASVDDLIAKKVLPKDAFEAIKAKVSVK